MSSILLELADLRRPEAAGSLGRRIGASEDAAARALAAAVPTLLSAFAQMTRSPGGARSLLASVEDERGGSLLDDVPGALGLPPSHRAEAILEEALGGRRTAVEAQIARPAGIDARQAREVLATSAALVLGALDRVRRRSRWSEQDLTRVLAGEIVLAEDAVPGSIGVLEELFESDAVSDIGEDVTEVGARLLDRLCGDRDAP